MKASEDAGGKKDHSLCRKKIGDFLLSFGFLSSVMLSSSSRFMCGGEWGERRNIVLPLLVLKVHFSWDGVVLVKNR